METQLRALQQEALDALEQATDSASLEAFRITYLGRKGGHLTAILRQLGSAAPEERPRLGQLANEIKADIELNSINYRDAGFQIIHFTDLKQAVCIRPISAEVVIVSAVKSR